MTCWIIHWAFAEEQMEGQTHMQTCSLADFFTPVNSSIYLDTHVYALKYFQNIHTHFQPSLSRGVSPSVSAAFDTQGASCQRHPCFLIPPSSPLTIWTETKNYQILLSPLFLPINSDFILFCHYFGFYASPWTLCGPSICRAFLTQLLLFFSSKLLRFNSYSNF